MGGVAADARTLLGGRHGYSLVRRARPRSSSFWRTSSSDFEPKFVIARRSSSVFVHQLADGVDPGPLQAVARTLRQLELLDRQLEVGRRRRRRHLAELEAAGLVAQVGDQRHEVAQRVAGRRQRVARRDRTVGLDLERELVVVGGLLDAGGLHRERHPAHGREDGVDRDEPDGRRALVALGREVAAALLDGEVDGEAALGVHRGQVQLGVEDLDVGGGLDVAGGDLTGTAGVEAQGHRLVGRAREHEVLDVEDEVGDVFLHARDDVELVQGLVEAHLRDRGARDRREQRAAQAVAERVAEARLERRDGELLEVALGLAGLDLGTLDDEHGCIASDLVIWPARAAAARGRWVGDYLE